MKIVRYSIAMAVSFVITPILLYAAPPVTPYADIVLYNGKVVTADKGFAIARAVAIHDGKFLFVGKTDDALTFAGPKTMKIDMEGKTVIPGLIDSHNHMDEAEEGKYRAPLFRAKTVAEAVALIKETADKTKPGEWIRGAYWHPLAQLKERRYLTRQDLDAAAPNNPVFLPTVGHAVMCNTYAMKIAGIGKETPNPRGGEIVRDAATGEPNGVFTEAAMSLVAKAVPLLPFDLRVEIFRQGMKTLNRAGLTAVLVGATDPDQFKVYQHIWAKGEGTIRTSVMYAPTGELTPSESEAEWEKIIRSLGMYSGFGDNRLNFAAIKLIVDGGMTLRTAYMRQPYPGEAGYYGSLLIPADRLNKLVAACNRNNWRVGIHCVGDAAIDKTLDAYEYANKEIPLSGKRFSLIHASLIQADQIERARKLGLRIEVQNSFMWDKAGATARFLGKEAANRACPTKSMIDAMGIESIGAGTDSPVNPHNPFINMYVMVTRKDINGTVYGADQKITREQALRLYTNGSAASLFMEHLIGSIETGKLADLVVISDDILTCPEESIKAIQAKMTMVGGKIVYEAGKP
jgi:predicted amidohydrolase YtcJ